MGTLLALAGQYAESRPYLERQFAANGNQFFGPSQFEAFLAEQLYAARKATGDAEGAEAVLAALEDNVERLYEAGITGTDWAHSTDYQAGMTGRSRARSMSSGVPCRFFW